MDPLLIPAAVLRQLGYGSWTLGISETIADRVQFRACREHVVVHRDLLSAPPSEIAVSFATADKELQHPGYEALCGGCAKRYFRSVPARADHHCLACGPVAGKLEFE